MVSYLSLAYINSNKVFAPLGYEEAFCKRIDDEKQSIKNDFFEFYPELWDKINDIASALEERDKVFKFKRDLRVLSNFYWEQTHFDLVVTIKAHIRELNQYLDKGKRIKLSQNRNDLILSIVNNYATEYMGLHTVKNEAGYAIIFNNEPYYFEDFLYSHGKSDLLSVSLTVYQ